MLEFKDLVNKRESCRNFSDQEIEMEKLKAIVEISRLAPSACNSQPWSLSVVTNKLLLSKIAQALQSGGMNKFTSKAKAFIVISEEKNYLKLVGAIKKVDYISNDLGIMCAYIDLSACSLGLSSRIIGWFNQKRINEALDLPKSKKIQTIIALGYSNNIPRKKVRKDIDKIVKYYQ